MKIRRLGAAVAAASFAAVLFVGNASPAHVWDLALCKKTWAAGKDHPDCKKFERHKPTTTVPKPTTTKPEVAPTTVAPATTKAPTTTVVVKSEVKKPVAVKTNPKFTG